MSGILKFIDFPKLFTHPSLQISKSQAFDGSISSCLSTPWRWASLGFTLVLGSANLTGATSCRECAWLAPAARGWEHRGGGDLGYTVAQSKMDVDDNGIQMMAWYGTWRCAPKYWENMRMLYWLHLYWTYKKYNEWEKVNNYSSFLECRLHRQCITYAMTQLCLGEVQERVPCKGSVPHHDIYINLYIRELSQSQVAFAHFLIKWYPEFAMPFFMSGITIQSIWIHFWTPVCV